MRPTQTITEETVRLLSVQAGVIAREQALGCGLSPKAVARLVRDERWTRIATGVYVKGCAEPTFEQLLWTGILLGGEPAAVGGQAALHKLGVGARPETVTIVVPAHVRRRLPLEFETLRDNRGRLDDARGSLPLIRVEDALLDATLGWSLEEFVAGVTDATRLGLTTAKEVERTLRLRDRHKGSRELLEVLADLQGIESNLEFVFRRDVLRAHGLPEGRRQVRTRRRRRVDVYFDEFGVIVEVDGRRGHQEGRFRDFTRDNDHAASLHVTLRFGSYDIRENACALAAQVGNALALRGWQGEFALCPNCSVH